MYSRLFDSMVIWYRQWFPHVLHRRIMAALALTVLMTFNLLSVVNLFGILGLHSVPHLVSGNRGFAISLFFALTLFNLVFALYKVPSKARLENIPSGSKKPAIYYMTLSAAVFFLSFVLLVILRPS
jgi:hypothetical protein